MNYKLKLVAVFLLCFGFSRADLCQNKFVVQNCTDSSKFQPNIEAFVYNLLEQSTSLLCPQTRTINGNSITEVPEWRVISSISGKFCTEANYLVQEICVVGNNNSVLVIDKQFFANMTKGEVTIDFVHNVTVFRNFTIRYADIGVYPHMNYTDVTATDGDAEVFFAFEIYIEKEKLVNAPMSLYHVRNDTKTPVNIESDDIKPRASFPCKDQKPYFCQCTTGGEIAHIFEVTLTNLTTANDGIYLLEVTTGSRNFSASITLSVIPSPTITSTSSTIISSPSTTPSSSQTTSPSQSPSQSPSSTPILTSSTPTDSPTISPVLYIGISIVAGVLVIVIIIIIIILVLFFCYRKNKTRNTPTDLEGGVEMKNGNHPVGNGHGPPPIINPRTSSVSSDRPLVGSATSSNVSTPTTKAPSDYTAVFCDEEHKNIGKMWKDKLGDAIHIMENIHEIIEALLNPRCIEILMYAKLTDELSKELISRGVPSDRSKLKWWQFVDKDRTPNNTIEINGFRLIQVEGDPNEFDTHQLGILKSEYPVLQHSTQGPKKQRKHHRGREETDYLQGSPQRIHHPQPVQTSTPQATLEDNGEVVGLLKETNVLLKKIAVNTEKGADLQKEQLEVSKDTRDLQQEGNEIASAQLAHQEEINVVEEEEKSPEDSVV